MLVLSVKDDELQPRGLRARITRRFTHRTISPNVMMEIRTMSCFNTIPIVLTLLNGSPQTHFAIAQDVLTASP